MCFNNNPIAFSDPSGLDGVPKQHTVAKGDDLTKLSKKYNTTINNLLKWNPNIKDKNKIYDGSKLNVSDPSKDLLIGTSGKVGTGEDAQSSVGVLPQGMKTDENANIPNGVLEKFHSSVSTTATLPMRDNKEWVADEANIYNQFYSRKGGVNTATTAIANEMSNSAPLKRLSNQIAGAFMSSMINNNGNYSAISMNDLFQSPSFSKVSKPLLALVGGTQQLDIYLSDIKVHGRQYTAKITFWLWDDYGVSAEDCMQPSLDRNLTPINDALKSQWILQHNRGYKSLINGFKFIKTISGGF
jgi:LysM repeat protein